jgi:predicted ABC-type ATPase
MPVLHLIAGPHGVGKTTLYEFLVAPRHPGLPFIEGVPHQRGETQARGHAECSSLLAAGQSLVAETALGDPSPLALMERARALGYEVVLYALTLDDPGTLLDRISQRVREGGPHVPSNEVLERYPRVMDNFRRAIRIADLSFLLDAADAMDGGPRLVASVMQGRFYLHTALRPRWVDKILGFAEG